MRLHFPIPGPYATVVFPRVAPYDISDPEPANWRLKFLAESSVNFWVHAVCSGWLSAVPPWELVESGIAPLSAPNHILPDTITLYLEPNRAFAPQAGTPLPFLFQSKLEQAGLGKIVRCYVYYNVDPNLFGAQIEQQLGLHATLSKVTSLPERRERFAEGQAAIWVDGGDALARASAHNASAAGRFIAELGVLTDTGLIDPVFFFETMEPYLHDPAKLSAFKNLVGTDWPFLAPSPAIGFLPLAQTAIHSAQQRLYPAPALYEAKQRLSLTSLQWRAVGDGQKKLYWDRLLRGSGHSTAGTPFVFDTNDMAHPFQLEAVTEFFMAWPEPSNAATLPSPESMQQASRVSLQDVDWNLVLIEPFHHASLGNPPLPKPDYFLKQHAAPDNTRCDSANPLPSPFNADTYAAVLFLVHHGEIKAWYRWSTYTAHKWECLKHAECHLASSAQGNQAYFFRSQTAVSKKSKSYINYGFTLSEMPGEWSVAGRFYFRAGTPEDDGTAAGDNTAKKTGVMIHIGETASIAKTQKDYNGSGGCLVSPSFPHLRNTMIEIFWEDEMKKPAGSRDQELLFLRNRTHSQCRAIRNGDILMKDGKLYLPEYWNGKITGLCYVIRPDEPTQK